MPEPMPHVPLAPAPPTEIPRAAISPVPGTTMTAEKAKQLREPFKSEQVGKLPKVSCKACTEASKKRYGAICDRHEKRKCEVCGNYITTGHVDLDYVGHAATTDRLLQVDPAWSWDFVATDPTTGQPVIGEGLWIKLTVCGVTRYGFGDGKSIKEMIGDAIRNAAMRFGVALDLWAKEDLSAGRDEEQHSPTMPPKEEVARVRDLAKSADIGDWVKDQGFPWPWTFDACASIEAKADEVLSAPFVDAPELPDAESPEPPVEETLPL